MGDAEGETDIGALTGLFGALRAAGLRVVDLAERFAGRRTAASRCCCASAGFVAAVARAKIRTPSEVRP